MTEEKQNDYAKIRRIHAMELGINNAVHGITNLVVFCQVEFWPEEQRHLWVNIRSDAEKVLSSLILLKTKLELVTAEHKPQGSNNANATEGQN